MKKYIKPQDVHAPKRRWSLIQVLFDGGPGGNSLAIGRWDNHPVLAMRWNGDDSTAPLGNPQSRGLPTWFIVPDQYWRQILEAPPFTDIHTDAVTLARNFLELKRAYFLSTCPNPSCPQYGGLVFQTLRPNQLQSAIEDLEKDKFKLWHVVCDHSWIPHSRERARIVSTLKADRERFCRAGQSNSIT
jgi:hypothetical protein